MSDFFNTRMGHRFFEAQLPQLTRAIENVAEELKRQNDFNVANQVELTCSLQPFQYETDVTEDEKKNLEVYKIANNVLYFADSSDYPRALWEILFLLNPELQAGSDRDLKYIGEDEKNG